MRVKLKSKRSKTKSKGRRDGLVKRHRIISDKRLLSSEPSGKAGLQYIHITGKFGVWVSAPKGARFNSVGMV